MAAPGKPYGLIFPKKTQQKTFVKHAVFMDESDEETSVGKSLQREAVKKQAMKQTKLEIQRALAEDATVYEYDNIYDDIQQKKAESQASVLAGKGEKKPKYIQNILKAAELRKKEQEKRMEKKIQKEREMEGNVFDDKEAFVTSAYKKKLQERAEEEEREKREAEIEACLDVTKQKDLSGFYRHLLNQSIGEEAVPQCSLREARLKEEEPDENPGDAKRRRSSDERTRARIPSKEAENPDADSDSETESSGEEARAKVHTDDGRATDKKETRRSSLDQSAHKRRRDSRSSSEERKPRSKTPPEGQEGGRKGKTGQHKERDGERRPHGDHEKEDQLQSKGGQRRKEEKDDRQRKKDRRERDEYDRDLKRERDKEDRYSQWELQMKERQTNRKGQPRDGEGKRERKRSSPQSEDEEEEEEDGRGQKGGVGKRGKENPPESKELKCKTSEEEEEEEGAEPAEKPPDKENRFAKRSSQETVVSARDRYLARQMARMGTKPYLEKEED